MVEVASSPDEEKGLYYLKNIEDRLSNLKQYTAAELTDEVKEDCEFEITLNITRMKNAWGNLMHREAKRSREFDELRLAMASIETEKQKIELQLQRMHEKERMGPILAAKELQKYRDHPLSSSPSNGRTDEDHTEKKNWWKDRSAGEFVGDQAEGIGGCGCGDGVCVGCGCPHREQFANRVIDQTFDSHRRVLRQKLKDAEAEIKRLRAGGDTQLLLQKLRLKDQLLEEKQREVDEANSKWVALMATKIATRVDDSSELNAVRRQMDEAMEQVRNCSQLLLVGEQFAFSFYPAVIDTVHDMYTRRLALIADSLVKVAGQGCLQLTGAGKDGVCVLPPIGKEETEAGQRDMARGKYPVPPTGHTRLSRGPTERQEVPEEELRDPVVACQVGTGESEAGRRGSVGNGGRRRDAGTAKRTGTKDRPPAMKNPYSVARVNHQ